jgi:hypothetical protein
MKKLIIKEHHVHTHADGTKEPFSREMHLRFTEDDELGHVHFTLTREALEDMKVKLEKAGLTISEE